MGCLSQIILEEGRPWGVEEVPLNCPVSSYLRKLACDEGSLSESNLCVFTLHMKHLPVARLGPWLVSEHKILPHQPSPQPVQSGAGMLLYFDSKCDKNHMLQHFEELDCSTNIL